ncbi:MAG: iron-containing alcohol dehydrogenase [Bacteriovoracaceae bacterium]|nr:iron-containing alcohol dehydrogenase [Bacteriovoracaceae bacterium]
MSELRKFVAPEIMFGGGARKLVPQYAKNLGVRRPMLVTDQGVIDAGWAKEIEDLLRNEGIEVFIYSNVTPNPRAEEVMIGADHYREQKCDGIIAIGGGSPMDCAKGIGIVVSNNQYITDFEGVDTVSCAVPPLIFVPSTAGTSADVSQFAIISDRANKVKIAIVSKKIVPDVALIDPDLTVTMDTYLTACTGMDAMVHAIEAYVSNASSPMTDLHALKGIELVHGNLLKVLAKPHDLKLREQMMLGSMEAGLAFSNAILGAVHAMAHSLGGLLDLPHGEANSILLEHVVNYNYSESPERFGEIAKIFGIKIQGMNLEQKKVALVQAIIDFRTAAGITNRLRDVGVKSTDLRQLAKNAVKDACMVTNPREADEDDVVAIYEEAS